MDSTVHRLPEHIRQALNTNAKKDLAGAEAVYESICRALSDADYAVIADMHSLVVQLDWMAIGTTYTLIFKQIQRVSMQRMHALLRIKNVHDVFVSTTRDEGRATQLEIHVSIFKHDTDDRPKKEVLLIPAAERMHLQQNIDNLILSADNFERARDVIFHIVNMDRRMVEPSWTFTRQSPNTYLLVAEPFHMLSAAYYEYLLHETDDTVKNCVLLPGKLLIYCAIAKEPADDEDCISESRHVSKATERDRRLRNTRKADVTTKPRPRSWFASFFK